MTAIWQSSRIPFIKATGAPEAGAKAYFYDADTSTPQTVYTTSALDIPHDSPVVADSRGMFPAIFMSPGTFRVIVHDSTDTLIFDDDGISVPQSSTYVAPDAGDTATELLARTGDIKARYGTGSHSGWVRMGGRTLGSASSGATERANSDCEDLFLFLWAADANLAVSGGRGGSAAGDWAANKTITLPDGRERLLAGLAEMGNTDAGLIADSLIDSSLTSSDLGATAGASTHALTEAEGPTHNHTATTAADGGFSAVPGTATILAQPGSNTYPGAAGASAFADHTHTITVENSGSGTAHNNMQPSIFVTYYIKL